MDQDLNAFRPSRLWKRLPAERRVAAAELFWEDEDSTDQQLEAVAAIATHMKFRTKSVAALPAGKLARYLANLPAVSDTIAARALVNYHLATQRPMMGAFLDSLGVEHQDGLIKDDEVTRPDPEKLNAAAAALATTFPAEDVALYLSTLVSQDPDTWGQLAERPETGLSAS